jgi:hypothetical protein
MKLYHFTAAHLVGHILRDGITLGVLPVLDEDGRVKFLAGPCQWLTDDPGWGSQGWATRKKLTYDRTAARLTVAIPKCHRYRLIRAYDYLPCLPPPTRRLITDWEGSEHWYLFFGKIPPGWIRKVEWKPETKQDLGR